MNACNVIVNAGRHRWLGWNKKQQRDTQNLLMKRGQFRLGVTQFHWGTWSFDCRIGSDDSLTKTKSFGDTSCTDTLGMTHMRQL